MTWKQVLFLAALTGLVAPQAHCATEIAQFGITWKFDADYETGQFVNGDWWVVGPVEITGITNSYHTHGLTPIGSCTTGCIRLDSIMPTLSLKITKSTISKHKGVNL